MWTALLALAVSACSTENDSGAVIAESAATASTGTVPPTTAGPSIRPPQPPRPASAPAPPTSATPATTITNGPACQGDFADVAGDGDLFFGRVVQVNFGNEWAIEPSDVALTPGAIAGTCVGPAVLHLADGRMLEVPARTPGGNWCFELVRPEDYEDVTGLENPTEQQVRFNDVPWDCFVYGGLDESERVAWFDVAEYNEVPFDQSGLGAGHARLRRDVVAVGDGSVILRGGIAFALAGTVRLDCMQRDLDELVDQLPNLEIPPRVVIDASTGEVVRLECTYRID